MTAFWGPIRLALHRLQKKGKTTDCIPGLVTEFGPDIGNVGQRVFPKVVVIVEIGHDCEIELFVVYEFYNLHCERAIRMA